MATKISFMTFNVWGKWNWPYRANPLKAFFEANTPDILVLQEVSEDILSLIDSVLLGHERVREEQNFEGNNTDSSLC
jgi:hypothetical protein